MIAILLGQAAATPVLAQTALSGRARAAFAEADLNNDGRLSRVEFDAAREGAFDRADANGNGRLSASELRALRAGGARPARLFRNRRSRLHAFSPGRVVDITEFRAMGAARFAAADLNHDGGIDRTETAAFLLNLGLGD